MSESASNKNYKNGHRNRKFRPHSKKKQGSLEENSKTEVAIDNNNSKSNFHKCISVNERENDRCANKKLGICTTNTSKNKKDLHRNKNSFIPTTTTTNNNNNNNVSSSNNNNQKKTNGSLKTLYTKDFTFKNGKEQKNQYCHVGTQTSKPIQLHINRIFNQGFELSHIPSFKEESINSSSQFQADEDDIGIRTEISYRRNSADISSINTRKWSDASTLVEDYQVNIPNTFRKSSSISSNATITEMSAATQISLSHRNEFSNQNILFFKDPYLVKEPLTIEDLNLTNALRVERDIKRLKSAIDKKNNSDMLCIEDDHTDNHFTIGDNTVINNLQYNEGLTTNMNHHENSNLNARIFMDIWLDYPACCYDSLMRE